MSAEEIIELTERLLASIAEGDWKTYSDLCDPSLSAFEPEARGHLVTGMPFHRFYFERSRPAPRNNTTIVAPHVRLWGDTAVIAYIRLMQLEKSDGTFVTQSCEETRVWQRQDGAWQHVHFHRSTGEQ